MSKTISDEEIFGSRIGPKTKRKARADEVQFHMREPGVMTVGELFDWIAAAMASMKPSKETPTSRSDRPRRPRKSNA